jgi:hypothetical protein
MDKLTAHTPARAEMDTCATHTPARAEMDKSAFNITAKIFSFDHSAIDRFPWSITTTEAAANPEGHTPHPPARNLWIEVVNVTLKLFLERFFFIHQPDMTGMKIIFDNRPICIMSYLIGCIFHGPPKITDHAVHVVDRLNTAERLRAQQVDRTTTVEWLDIAFSITEPLPNNIGHGRLAAEPWVG